MIRKHTSKCFFSDRTRSFFVARVRLSVASVSIALLSCSRKLASTMHGSTWCFSQNGTNHPIIDPDGAVEVFAMLLVPASMIPILPMETGAHSATLGVASVMEAAQPIVVAGRQK